MTWKLRKILVPVDGSEDAARAAVVGAELARKFDAELTLLHVYDSAVVGLMGFGALSGKQIDDAIERISSSHLASAQQAVESIKEARCEVRVGNPGHEICAFAEHMHADLIVIGSRGISGVRRFLVGSVSANVVRHATCSVMVAR